MESLEEEIKSTLQVMIGNFKLIDEVYYYTILLSKLHSIDSFFVEKRFSQFHALNEALKASGFQDLPKLPSKTIFAVKGEECLEKRRIDL